MTIGRVTPSRAAISVFFKPSAAANTILERSASPWALVWTRPSLELRALLVGQLDFFDVPVHLRRCFGVQGEQELERQPIDRQLLSREGDQLGRWDQARLGSCRLRTEARPRCLGVYAST